MKQLLILICLIGWMNTSFNLSAQTVPTETQNQLSDLFPGFTPPEFMGSNNTRNNNPLSELLDLIYQNTVNNIELVSSISAFQKESKFQLIINKEGKVIDCQLLQSSNMTNDNTILKYLSAATLFLTPPMMDGNPCNAVGIFKITYSTMGNGSPHYAVKVYEYKHSFDFYPLLTGDTADL